MKLNLGVPAQPAFYNVMKIDLTNARASQEIEMMGGFIYVLFSSDAGISLSVQLNQSSNDLLPLSRQFGVIGQFSRFFITNAAQAGKTAYLLVSSSFDDLRLFEQVAATSVSILSPNVPVAGVTPTVYNVTCNTIGTEYSQNIGLAKRFLIRFRTGNGKVCYSAGQSGTTFVTVPTAATYAESELNPASAITLYFQNDAASAVAEIVAWT